MTKRPHNTKIDLIIEKHNGNKILRIIFLPTFPNWIQSFAEKMPKIPPESTFFSLITVVRLFACNYNQVNHRCHSPSIHAKNLSSKL